MAQGVKITSKQRDIISALVSANKPTQEICELIDCSNQTVYTQAKLEDMIKNDRFNEAIDYVQKQQMGTSVLEWALKKYGKTLPQKKTEPNQYPEKDKEASTIDKNQMARIMMTLSKIDASLENIDRRVSSMLLILADAHKEQNANADNLYNLVKDLKGAMVEGMRKMR